MNNLYYFSTRPVEGSYDALHYQFGIENCCFTVEIESNHYSFVEKSNNLQFKASLGLKKKKHYTDFLTRF